MQVRAVDTSTFAHSAVWPIPVGTWFTAPSLSLDRMMTRLAAQRETAIQQDVVPVFVDAQAWNNLKLHVGSTFTIEMSQLSYTDLHCVVLGKLEHIPTINDSTYPGLPDEAAPPGGVLLDYQTYASVYTHDSKILASTSGTLLPINHFWLRTRNDATSLQ